MYVCVLRERVVRIVDRVAINYNINIDDFVRHCGEESRSGAASREHYAVIRRDIIMAYCGVQHRLLAKQPFTSYDEFYKFVHNFQYASFHTKATRDRVRDAWQSLVQPAPFSRTVRFPDEFCVHLSATALRV